MQVSVITPVFNTQEYLHRCIQSVLDQTDIKLELILINDGSTDNSLSIINQYKKKDSRVKIFDIENSGQGFARNIGLDHAQGEFVYFLDSDDYLSKDALKILYRSASEHKLDICSPGVPMHYFAKSQEDISCLPCKSQFIRKKIIDKYNIRQPNARSGQDGVFSHLVLTKTERVGVNPKAVLNYTAARPGSTFVSYLKKHDVVPDLISCHLRTISEFYTKNNCWISDARRFLIFIFDETIKNRIIPHYGFWNDDEKNKVFNELIDHISEISSFYEPEDAFIKQIFEISSDYDLVEFMKFFEKNIDIFSSFKFSKQNNNFKHQDGTYIVKKISNKVVEEKKHKKEIFSLEDKIHFLDKKMDFILNTINNSSFQVMSRSSFGRRSCQEYGVKGLIVSLTTLPSRLNFLHLTLESIFNQSILPEKICLWMTGKAKDLLTPELLDFQKYGLEINFIEDIGPHTKIYYSLLNYRDKSIISVDDDMVYPVNMIESLWATSLKNPGCIVGNWVRELSFDVTGRVMGVRDGELLTPAYLEKNIEPNKEIIRSPNLKGFAYGTCGVLYPPECMDERVFDISLFKELCPKEDDIWFKAMSLLKGTPVVPTNLGINPSHHSLTGSQEEALRYHNHGNSENIKQMRKVFKYFDLYKILN